MWIVRVALDRPYTFVVLALLILILSPVMILRTPTDIVPNINVPVVAVAWTYTGMNPEELEGRLTSTYERVWTTTVDNIEHLESFTVRRMRFNRRAENRRGRGLVIEMKHIMKISPEGENVILELNAECLTQSWEAVNQSGFPHQTVIPQNSGRAAILSRFSSRN